MGAGIVLIAVVALAILGGAAALPRGLLMAAFVTLIATAALVILFEVAPTGDSSAVVLSHSIIFLLWRQLRPGTLYRRCRRAAT